MGEIFKSFGRQEQAGKPHCGLGREICNKTKGGNLPPIAPPQKKIQERGMIPVICGLLQDCSSSSPAIPSLERGKPAGATQ